MFQTTNQLPTFALINIQDTWSASSFLDLAAAAASWQGSHLPRRTCGVLGAFLSAWCVNGHPTRWTFCWEYDEPVDCDTMVLPTFPQLVRHSWASNMNLGKCWLEKWSPYSTPQTSHLHAICSILGGTAHHLYMICSIWATTSSLDPV
jgi:hypothetical protein